MCDKKKHSAKRENSIKKIYKSILEFVCLQNIETN